jgi:hypothetical protein
MSITEGQPVLPAATPPWRSLYFWILFVLGVGAIYLTYRTAGSEALFAVLLSGSLVGAGFVVVTHRWLQWYSLLVFGGVMIGGIAAVELTVRDGSVPVNWLHDSGVPTISSDSDMPFMILGRHAAFGALVGGVVSTMAGGWLVARSGLRIEESARRWYLPSKGALIGLVVFASCAVLIGVSTKHDGQRYRDRLEALDAITKLGGSVEFPPDKDRLSHDAREVDLRDSRLTDAELDYVIALNPQQLRLGVGVTDEGVKKLQQALPNCKITR